MKTKILFGILFVLALMSFVSAQTCTDSDNGKNYYNKGHIEGLYFENQQQTSVDDVCIFNGSLTGSCEGDNCKLVEYYCDSSPNESLGSFVNLEEYTCPNGCEDGACIGENQEQEQTCTPECYCGMKEVEYSICIRSDCSSVHIPCENGCDNVIGKCRTQENPEVSEKVTCFFMNSDERHDCFFNSRNGGEVGCSGTGNCTVDSFGFRYDIITWNSDCFGEAKTLLDQADEKIYFDCDPNKCKEIGLRESGNYCSSDNKWEQQKGDEQSCENNFECSSNLCIDNQCVDSGLFTKIIRWFQNLFGKK